MTEDEPDWAETIRISEGSRSSRRRQFTLVAGIFVVSIALLVGLVAAGAALFRVASDRAHHTTPSYEYGKRFARSHAIQASPGLDVRQVCSLAIAAGRPPAWLKLGEAAHGCADAAA